jgi:hypothetical protein
MRKDGRLARAMTRTTLEAQLTSLTLEFVGRLVEVIRNASFADVAALSPHGTIPRGSYATTTRSRGANRAPKRAPAMPETASVNHGGGGGSRQTKAHREELGERVIKTLSDAPQPLGVRALSTELGVPADRLAAPLRELRAAGRIQKHGEKRSTTYSSN